MRYLLLVLVVLISTSTLKSQNFIRNGEYIIISAINEKVLDVAGEKKDNGTNIKVWEHNGNTCQLFNISFDSKGVFRMKAKHSNKYVTIENNSNKDLTNIIQWESDGSNSQLFTLEPVPHTDMFVIVGVQSQKALTVDPNSGNVILMPKPSEADRKDENLNQYWRFSQRVRFENTKADRVIDVPNGNKQDGVKLVVWERNTGKNQAFDLMPVVNSEEYYIRNVQTKKYFTIDNKSTDAVKKLHQSSFEGSEKQKFNLEKVSDFTYYIKHTGSSLVLDLQQSNGGNGTEIKVVNKEASSTQQWRMVTFDPNPTKTLQKEIKKELKDTGEKTKDKIKDVGKKTKDKLKKLFK